MDQDHSGQISIENAKTFKRSVSGTRMSRSNSGLESVASFSAVDFDNSGTISYSEFMVANVTIRHLTPTNLKMLFEFYDTDNSNYLTVENLKHSFRKQGKMNDLKHSNSMWVNGGFKID
jgi:Ca2+-binding EF-hand superfamily protein